MNDCVVIGLQAHRGTDSPSSDGTARRRGSSPPQAPGRAPLGPAGRLPWARSTPLAPAPERSPTTDSFADMIETVAMEPDATVLLLGETGVGKSYFAQRIHRRSPRRKAPFVIVNCASLGPQLAESELFGHERGAFTGAITQKRGLVEVAAGGTVMLDEVGELSSTAQAQLLTFLDTRSFRRVGGTRTLRADVRIIAATNRDLDHAVREGVFRCDLFYRISVLPLLIPPLRERRSEIPQLARTILAELQAERGKEPPLALDGQLMEQLEAHDWPGNLRELRNVLQRMLIMRHIEPGAALAPNKSGHPQRDRGAHPANSTLAELERKHILRVLEAVDGNRTRAAEVLGIGRSTLKRKLSDLRSAGQDGIHASVALRSVSSFPG